MTLAASSFKCVCGALVFGCVAYVALSLLRGDNSGKPSRAEMDIAFSPFHQVAGGESQYFDKLTLKGIYATSRLPSAPEAIRAVAGRNGWAIRPYGERRAKFCKSRFAVVLEQTGRGSTEYGIYWTSDRHNPFYCASR